MHFAKFNCALATWEASADAPAFAEAESMAGLPQAVAIMTPHSRTGTASIRFMA
jgi:hypothetical protein